jgi:hypothetical protein
MAKKAVDTGAASGPSHEMVARRAYEIWQSEGCPEGRAMEHWLRAVSELKRPSEEAREEMPEPRSEKPRTGKRGPRVVQGRI